MPGELHRVLNAVLLGHLTKPGVAKSVRMKVYLLVVSKLSVCLIGDGGKGPLNVSAFKRVSVLGEKKRPRLALLHLRYDQSLIIFGLSMAIYLVEDVIGHRRKVHGATGRGNLRQAVFAEQFPVCAHHLGESIGVKDHTVTGSVLHRALGLVAKTIGKRTEHRILAGEHCNRLGGPPQP